MSALVGPLLAAATAAALVVLGSWMTGFNDRRRDEREDARNLENRREQRDEKREDRKERREENKHEMQKKTLLEMQDALQAFYQALWQVIVSNGNSLPNSGVFPTLSTEISSHFHESANTVSKLAYRILDKDLRSEIHRFYGYAYAVRDTPTEFRNGLSITKDQYMQEQRDVFIQETSKTNVILGKQLEVELDY